MRRGASGEGPQTQLGGRLWWLIFGRLALALLLVMGVLWAGGTPVGVASLSELSPIIVALTALSLLYCAGHLLSDDFAVQARIQLFADAVLVTWLVWTSGDVRSPYAAFYIVIISVAGFFVGPHAVMITSAGSVAAFTAAALATIGGFNWNVLPNAAAVPLADKFQSIGLFDVSFLAVGLLAAKLAARELRSDVQLAAATQSLANLRALHERIIESIRSGVITTDLQGRIYTFNSAAEEITGTEAGEVRGQDVSIFFGDMTQRIAEAMAAAAYGKANPRFEADCLTPARRLLRLGFSVSPLFAESGETSGMVITFQDLTEVRALEEISRRQDRLAAIGRLAASIAHEIRNPLAAMRGSIQMLRAEMDGRLEPRQLMEIITRESDRLNKIVADYLSYARPRPAQMASVNVRALLQETFKLLRNSEELGEHHTLEEDLPDEPVMAWADSEQLRQVFWNVARNALKAMPQGGTFKASLARLGANRLQLAFSDTGCGMSPEQVEHLFEPFTSTTDGVGLGLSIVYQIIRDHNGTINVRSRLGEGTTITIELQAER